MAINNAVNCNTTGIVGFTGTAFTASTMTQYLVVLGSTTSSTQTQVSGTGTAAQVLTSNGAGANPTWQDAAGGSAGANAFLATKSTSQANVTGDGTMVTVTYTNEVFDVSGAFASNTFTAPATGKYAFSASCGGSLGSASTSSNIYFVASNRTLNAIRYYVNEVNCVFNASCTIDMDASDTIVVQYQSSGGAADASIMDIGYFGGYRVS